MQKKTSHTKTCFRHWYYDHYYDYYCFVSKIPIEDQIMWIFFDIMKFLFPKKTKNFEKNLTYIYFFKLELSGAVIKKVWDFSSSNFSESINLNKIQSFRGNLKMERKKGN